MNMQDEDGRSSPGNGIAGSCRRRRGATNRNPIRVGPGPGTETNRIFRRAGTDNIVDRRPDKWAFTILGIKMSQAVQ